MRKRIGTLFVGVIIGASIGGASIAAAASDSVNDSRDVITCPKSTTEDFRFERALVRLADGGARVTFACPK